MTSRRSNNYLIKYTLKHFEIAKKRLKTFKTLKRLKPGAKRALKLQCTVFPYKKRKKQGHPLINELLYIIKQTIHLVRQLLSELKVAIA